MDFQWFSHAPGTARQHLQELRQKSGAPGWTTHWKSMGKSSNYSWGDMKYVLCLLCLITGGYIRGVWWGLYEIDSANVNDFHVFFRYLEMVYMGEVFEPLLIGRVHWTMFLGGMVFFQQTWQKKVLCWKIYIYIYIYVNTISSTWFSLKKIVT